MKDTEKEYGKWLIYIESLKDKNPVMLSTKQLTDFFKCGLEESKVYLHRDALDNFDTLTDSVKIAKDLFLEENPDYYLVNILIDPYTECKKAQIIIILMFAKRP